jgi:hypothetical protein
VDFLQWNKDMFAWSTIEMLGVSQEVTEHTLNIKPGSKLVKHRAMAEELSRLLATGFVKEV